MADKIDRSSCLIGFPHTFILSGTQNFTNFNFSCGFTTKFVSNLHLGTDHLTLEGGGGGVISGSFFFTSNLGGQDIFFLSSFLCRIFFPQKSVVFTFTLWLLQ